MMLNQLLTLLFLFSLTACHAYRATPENIVLFTREDLTKKGFILAPISVPDSKLNPGPSDLAAYDLILAHTLKERWPKAPMLSSPELALALEPEAIEGWRLAIAEEDQGLASPSTLRISKELTRLGRSFPRQVLLPTLLQNSSSCGQREALATQLNPDPNGFKAYCQRVIKMRFRIMTIDSAELLWNGLIYATQETTSEILSLKQAEAEVKQLEPPAMQSLVRECFKNFATQFSER